MEYRRLGSAGLKVSLLSLGSWVTYGKQVDVSAAEALMKAAWDIRGELLRQRGGLRRRASPKRSWAPR